MAYWRVDGVRVVCRRTERRWRGGPRCRTERRSAPRWPRPGPGSAGSRRSARVHRASRRSGRPHGLQSSRPGSCSLVMGWILPARPRRLTTTVRVNRTWAIDTGAAARVGAAAGETTGAVGGGQPGAHLHGCRVRPSGSRRRRPTARPRRRRRRWRAGRCGGTAAPRGAAAPAGRGRWRPVAGRGRSPARRRAPAATTAGRPASTAHPRGHCAAGVPGRPRGRRPGRRPGGGPTPTVGPAARRPAAYSASSSPWHCTRMASVIRSPRRGDG